MATVNLTTGSVVKIENLHASQPLSSAMKYTMTASPAGFSFTAATPAGATLASLSSAAPFAGACQSDQGDMQQATVYPSKVTCVADPAGGQKCVFAGKVASSAGLFPRCNSTFTA